MVGPYEKENVKEWRDTVPFLTGLNMFPMHTANLSSEIRLLRIQNKMGMGTTSHTFT